MSLDFLFDIWCFNATFNDISAILWRPVLVVEAVGVPGENHRHGQATGKLYHLRLRVECTFFILKPGANPSRIGDKLENTKGVYNQ